MSVVTDFARRGGAWCALSCCLWGMPGAWETSAAGLAVRINFQPATAAGVDGYVADYGHAFGPRTNDLWYGWNVDSRAGAFERHAASDQRLDTGNKMQAGGQARFWEIQVPNGVYDVVMAAGDPADTNGALSGTRYHVLVENSVAVSDAVPASGQWAFHPTRHFQVSVADGLLTIANGPRGTNNSICFVEITQVAPIYWGAAVIDNANTHKAPNDYVSESNPGVLGYFEGHTGKKISLLHWGNGNTSALSGQTNYMAKMWARGTIPVYSWGPTSDSLTNILAGRHDAYFSNWFATAKAYGKPFFLNFAREMNGTWYTWSEGHTINAGCPPGSFTNMWRRVHDICTKQVRCTNITWVWVADRDINNTKHLQPIGRFYPGDEYVDWLGIDLYNAGQVAPYTGESFTALYGTTYSNVVNLSPGKPVMICETATKNLANTPKPAWITEALSRLPSAFPNIRGFLWFNWNDNDTSKNWPIQGGDNALPYTIAPVDWASVSAFSNGIASPYYLPNLFSNQALVTGSPIAPISLPEAPLNARAVASLGRISLSWSPAPGATNYVVYRRTGLQPVARQGGTSTPHFTDNTVTNGVHYHYVIRAANLAGESLDAKVSATPGESPSASVAPPSDLKAGAASTNRIELRWADNSTNELGFAVEWAGASNGPFAELARIPAGSTAHADMSGLAARSKRYYRVRALGMEGASGPSNVACATTFATNRTVVARYVISPATIDGELPGPAWQLNTGIDRAVLGTPNNAANFGVLWDTNYLYVGIKVMDASLIKDSPEPRDDDGVEVYIDGAHNKLPAYDSNDRLFQMVWNDPILREIGGRSGGVLHQSAISPGGGNYELAIPWSSIGVSAASDLTIGFDAGVNDDDDGGRRDSQLSWSGSTNNLVSTAAFGDLYLSALEAPLGVLHGSPILTFQNVGRTVALAWPAEHLGWRLQSQVNPPGSGLRAEWTTLPGSTATNLTFIVPGAEAGSAFFRLVGPRP